MNHRAAVPLLKTARAAWESDSRAETYVALALGAAGLYLVAREVRRMTSIWSTDKN